MTTKKRTHPLLTTIGFLLVLAMASLLFASAQAQSVPGKMTLSWQLPTVGCNRNVSPPVCGPLTGSSALTAINVYIDTQPIPDDFAGAPTLALNGETTTATHTMQVPNGTRLYARVRAVNPAGASDFSEQVSKLIAIDLEPGVPTNVTLDIEIVGLTQPAP